MCMEFLNVARRERFACKSKGYVKFILRYFSPIRHQSYYVVVLEQVQTIMHIGILYIYFYIYNREIHKLYMSTIGI